MDCGPTCLKIIFEYYDIKIPINILRDLTNTSKIGVNLKSIQNTAEEFGFNTIGGEITFEELMKEANFPLIAHWNGNHFIVVYKVTKKHIYTVDPAFGKIKYTHKDFKSKWCSIDDKGIVLLFEFDKNKIFKNIQNTNQISKLNFVKKYLFKYKNLLFQLFLSLCIVSLFQLLIPVLTQKIIDEGVIKKNKNLVIVLLYAQIALLIGRTIIESTRSYIIFNLSIKFNLHLIADFLSKLMKLPLSFFNTKMVGDIFQRISDHHRIENIMTNHSIMIFFSLLNFFIYSFLLISYDLNIFYLFSIGSIVYILWILIFLKKREFLDHQKFKLVSEEKNKLLELIQGIQEIKLNNAEKIRKEKWEEIQINIYDLEKRTVKLEMIQSNGSNLINEFKNIFLVFYTSLLVINNEISFGTMMAISLIIGQLNGPISQFIGFIYNLQDAKISLERILEIHEKENEELEYYSSESNKDNNSIEGDIEFKNVSFTYPGSITPSLKNINIIIPKGKTTAIVGPSGSGKTTILRLILRYYDKYSGEINLNNLNLNSISHKKWRENIGFVLQDGFIFSDSIINNIAINDKNPNYNKVCSALKIANLNDFVENLPLKLNTKIGEEGIGLSGGQKQRILISRAVYKNPKFIFFDEATSSLDANNEKIISQNLTNFFTKKTSIIIAHRLSTIINADQIIVMNNGEIVEVGTHKKLLNNKGLYYDLIKNQIEMN